MKSWAANRGGAAHCKISFYELSGAKRPPEADPPLAESGAKQSFGNQRRLFRPTRNGTNHLFYSVAAVFLLFSSSTLSSGCVYLVAGGVGALGGYVVSPDTIEGILETSHEEAADAAREIAKIMGKIEAEDRPTGEVVAIINGARVTINVLRLSQTSTKLSVKARKSFLPKIAAAQEVYVKIVNHLGL